MNWRVEVAQVESYWSATRSQRSCSNFVNASFILRIDHGKQKSVVTKEERALLETVDGMVRSESARARIVSSVGRVRGDLAGKADGLMAWEPIPLETFDALPPSIQSVWVFILRRGTDTG